MATPVLTGVMLVILVMELLPVWPLILRRPIEPTQVYSYVAKEEGEFAVLELPLRMNSYRLLYYGASHEKRTVGGAVDKTFRNFERHALRMPFLRSAVLLGSPRSRRSDVFDAPGTDLAAEIIAGLDIRYAIVHKWNENVLSFGPFYREEPMVEEAEKLIRPYFEFFAEDELVRVFRRVRQQEDWLFPVLGLEWGSLEDHGDYADRPLVGNRGTIYVHASKPGTVALKLSAATILEAERVFHIRLNGRPFGSVTIKKRPSRNSWHEIELGPLPIQPGSNTLELITPDPVRSIAEVYSGQDTRKISLVLNRLELQYSPAQPSWNIDN
jgi:hypothetical protein